MRPLAVRLIGHTLDGAEWPVIIVRGDSGIVALDAECLEPLYLSDAQILDEDARRALDEEGRRLASLEGAT